jgi:predicted metal-binding membrane protein
MSRRFALAMLVVFTASVAMTIALCRSMIGGMPMPGGWTMSMAWMPMPGQSRAAAVAMFLLMWIVMMVAMMLPSLAPVMWRRVHRATFAAGYFFAWTMFGVLAYAAGTAVSTAAMQSVRFARSIPIAAAIALVIAGVVQLTRWKLHHLDCCRAWNEDGWRGGIRYGLHCGLCCFTLIAALLIIGVMNLVAMAVVTAAITIERLLPRPDLVARIIGAAMIAAGLLVMAPALAPHAASSPGTASSMGRASTS